MGGWTWQLTLIFDKSVIIGFVRCVVVLGLEEEGGVGCWDYL